MALTELILIILLLFAALALCILIIPFSVSFNFTKKDCHTKSELEVGWLMGLVNKKFNNETGKVDKEAEKEKTAKNEKSGIIEQFDSLYSAAGYIPDFFELFYYFLKFTRDIVFSLKIKKIKLRAVVGFPEPGYTGILAGCLYFFRGLSYAAPVNYDISIESDFNVPFNGNEVKLDVFFKTTFEIRIINFVIHLLKFILRKPARRIMWAFITGKIKFKRK
ncbi:hypothetical protein BEH94_01280 [Candidatus Altiarchaeales archaeon WOR_SM1_SCG]|nr:hypothetical protein BEH94_01280 [Candidatus Altiarchaeales archaeon WOR_SM1_SCG]